VITLTRPDGSTLLVNPDRIETVEQTPDTVVTFADGKKLLVRETAADVAARFLTYHRAVRALPEGLDGPVARTSGNYELVFEDEAPVHGATGTGEPERFEGSEQP
jgi:flagellar protein FlbD